MDIGSWRCGSSTPDWPERLVLDTTRVKVKGWLCVVALDHGRTGKVLVPEMLAGLTMATLL